MVGGSVKQGPMQMVQGQPSAITVKGQVIPVMINQPKVRSLNFPVGDLLSISKTLEFLRDKKFYYLYFLISKRKKFCNSVLFPH